MPLLAIEKSVSTHYIPFPVDLQHRCISCHSKTIFKYPSAGHTFRDFTGYHKEIYRLHICTNPLCPFHTTPFNPSPSHVLSYKHYSLGIWKWIAQEAKIMKQSPVQILNRIKTQFGITMAEYTIRVCIKEIDVFLSNEIDKKTRDILKNQKKVLLAMDGQKPDDEGNALWLFVDLISNRVLKVVILQSADAQTLHKQVTDIQTEYDVVLMGGVSDKQNSIVRMHKEYFSDVPWQYCHFHFLQNLWNHIEVKDGNLHKKLSKMVKDLYILSASKTIRVYFEGLGKKPVREVFHEMELQLRAILKARTKKFEHLRGVEVFERITSLVEEMGTALVGEDENRRIVKIMKKTFNILNEGLHSTREQYETCISLNSQFQQI